MVKVRSSQRVKKKTASQKNDPTIVESSSREWKLLIEEKDYCMGKINMYSSFQVIADIKEKLSKRQEEMFAQTCFGQFLKLQRTQFAAQLVHHILLRQLECPPGENSMWFRIGGKEYEFGLKEFALITGLDGGQSCSLEVEGKSKKGIRHRYFGGKDTVKGEVLDSSFKNCNGDNDEDVVKLAQLYFLERFLLGKDCRRATEKFPIGLVDNAKDFNMFPWGSYLYGCLVESIKRLLKARDKKNQKMAANVSNINYLTYELHGFPYVLQFWAFECIPLVGEKFARRIDRKIPQMLNWEISRRGLGFNLLEVEVFNADKPQVNSGMLLTEDEMNEEYLSDSSRRKKSKKKNEIAIGEEDKSFVEKADKKVTKRKNHEKSKGNGSDDENCKENLCHLPMRKKLKKNNETNSNEEEKSFVEKSQEKVTVGNNLEECEDNGKIHINEDENDPKKYYKDGKIQMNEDENDQEKHNKDENIDTTVGDTHIKGGMDWKSEFLASIREEFLAWTRKEFLASVRKEFLTLVREEFLTLVREEILNLLREELPDSVRQEARKTVREEISRTRSTRRAEMSVKMTRSKQKTNDTDQVCVILSEAEDKDDNEDKYTVQRKRKTDDLGSEGDIPCFTVDLFEPPPHHEKEEFDQWIKVGLKRNKKNKYSDVLNKLDPVFDFTIETCKTKDWFFLLNETGKWLNSTHIDVALYFVRKKKKDHPDVFKPRCTTTDWLFQAILDARYPQFKKNPEKFSWEKESYIQETLKGIEPHHSLPWVDVDIIYIPLNVDRKHWVLLVLDLKKRTLYVYDSYHAAKHDKEVMLACRQIAEMVPWILKSVGFFDARKDVEDATSPFEVKRVDGIPQQDNGGDCGMFMLKFIEFMMQDTQLDACTQEKMPFFRNKMAVELYAYGKKRMVKKLPLES